MVGSLAQRVCVCIRGTGRDRRQQHAGHCSDEAGNTLLSDHHGGGQRSRRSGLRFELGASGPKHHRLHVHRFRDDGKWLEILKEAAPGVSRALLMFNPGASPHYYVYLRSFEAVPRSIAVDVTAAPVRDTSHFSVSAFRNFASSFGKELSTVYALRQGRHNWHKADIPTRSTNVRYWG